MTASATNASCNAVWVPKWTREHGHFLTNWLTNWLILSLSLRFPSHCPSSHCPWFDYVSHARSYTTFLHRQLSIILCTPRVLPWINTDWSCYSLLSSHWSNKMVNRLILTHGDALCQWLGCLSVMLTTTPCIITSHQKDLPKKLCLQIFYCSFRALVMMKQCVLLSQILFLPWYYLTWNGSEFWAGSKSFPIP